MGGPRSGSRISLPHKFRRGVLCHAPLVICDPSFCCLLCSEARHRRGVITGHGNFNSIGQVLLRNNPIGSPGMRMFCWHACNMVIDCRNAKSCPECRAGSEGERQHLWECQSPRLVGVYLFNRCSKKNLTISRDASGPCGSVWEPDGLPPAHACPASRIFQCSHIVRPSASA